MTGRGRSDRWQGVKGRPSDDEGGDRAVPIEASGKSLKSLNQKKEVKLKLKVSFAPDGGPANVRQVKVTLVKR